MSTVAAEPKQQSVKETVREYLPSAAQISSAAKPHCVQNVGEIERWGSAAIGSVLLLDALTGRRGLIAGLAGAALVHRGWTGHCMAYNTLGISTANRGDATAIPAQQGVRVEHVFSVNRSAKDLYGFWRDVENLPGVMRHLKSVESIDNQRSRWTAVGPMDYEFSWEAEVYNDRENEMIAWRSLPGGDIETAGSIHFKQIGGDRGTEVTVNMKYNPPGGKWGDRLASLLGRSLEQELVEDLRAFKRAMEAGEVITTKGQPSGRQSSSK